MAVPSAPGPRLDDLTLEEKASLCLGSDFWHTAPVARAGIPAVRLSDGPHGLRRAPDEGDQLTVGGSLPATCFPTAAALGSSFDPNLARAVGRAIAAEALAQGVAVVLGPGVNIKRSPLCGRNFEYFSEDPLVSGVMGAALVQGIQSRGVGTSVKHFAANNQETDRARVSADVQERVLREIYFPAFERVVKDSQPWTVMCSYNKVNGTYASEHHWLLSQVLREEWGFEGLVMSDWGAVHDRVAAIRAGLDLEMPPKLGWSDAALVAAVRSGELDESVLDTAVRRVLALVDRAAAAQAAAPVDVDAHHALARAAARECVVLLKNQGDVLPLAGGPGQSVCVVGALAQAPRYQGGGSSQVNPTRVDVPFEELRTGLPAGTSLTYAQGYALDGGDDPGLAEEAVAAARQAGTVIVFMGLAEADESEGYDRAHIMLPANQVSLLHRLAEANRRTVVVLANGSVVQVSDWDSDAAAILECWLAGQAAGGAVADVLTGAANPSGRLTETVPLRLEDNPSYLSFPGEHGHVVYGEGIFVGYRGYDKAARAVSYPFGHGLSYTTFAYSDLRVAQVGSHAAGDLAITVTCSVANTGPRPGKEVVQLYVSDLASTVARPVRELKGFEKVDLGPGQHGDVTFTLDARDLSYWSSAAGTWALEAGDFEISVGSSSRDLPLRATVTIDAPALRLPLTHMSSLQEWLADPDGAAALRAIAAKDTTGALSSFVGNDDFVRMIGNFPISTLAFFAGFAMDAGTVKELLAEAATSAPKPSGPATPQ